MSALAQTIARRGFRPPQPYPREQVLGATAAWLARAQDATPDDGVAAWYDLSAKRWQASYPETTGYIIPTLYHYADVTGEREYAARATRMADWESGIQLPDGGVRAGTMADTQPTATVFNTGQVLFGWAAAWRETGEERFRQSLLRAADWLLAAQDSDGAWRRFASPYAGHVVNTYNTRVAFALAYTGRVLGSSRFVDAAGENVSWALSQARCNDWLENNDLEDNARPLTHTIAYACRGILEVGVLVKEPLFMVAAENMANAVAAAQRSDGALPGRLDGAWRPAARWSCLTGNAQMAIVWLRLAALSGDRKWRTHAENALRFVQSSRDESNRDPGIRGGIGGSSPLRGGYMRRRYPNWAAKFFLDALQLLDTPEWVPDA